MNIRDLTKEAGLKRHQEQAPGIDGAVGSWEELEQFAKLVAAHEREECAGFAERRVLATENNDQKIGYYHACKTIAAGIRARSKA